MFKKTLTIKLANDDVFDNPQPSKLFVPDWYKQTPPTLDNSKMNKTIKKCVPFLDALTSGYIAELWSDVEVTTRADGAKIFQWPNTFVEVIEEREISSSQNLPVPAGHSYQRLVWKSPFYIQTPFGSSALITHPFNRYDLPFTTLSAIVDTDSVMFNGRIPFFIKNDFEGIIKKGTPIFQILPFKRDNWQSEIDNTIIQKGIINNKKSLLSISGWYKQNAWKRKNYD